MNSSSDTLTKEKGITNPADTKDKDERTATLTKKELITGNEAIAMGALAAGCKCFFGYPITPQNEIPEYMSYALPASGGQFVQAESEIAAVNMLLGACATGIRAMTSSSSPGMSLKQEGVSYLAGSELPAVLVNMSRGGPGLGGISSAQGDYYQATRGGGHGDYRVLVLAPATCQEAYDLIIKAFDSAFAWRNPVMLLADALLGQMKEPVQTWQPDFVDDKAQDWQLSGSKGRQKRLIKSVFLADGELAARNTLLSEKYIAMKKEATWESVLCDDADLVVCAYGSIARIVKSTIRSLREEGFRVGLFRPVTLYPFPEVPLAALARENKGFLTIEHNCGQMLDDVRLAVRTFADSDFFSILPGNMPNPDELRQPILNALEASS